jgi:hypothetical protein
VISSLRFRGLLARQERMSLYGTALWDNGCIRSSVMPSDGIP